MARPGGVLVDPTVDDYPSFRNSLGQDVEVAYEQGERPALTASNRLLVASICRAAPARNQWRSNLVKHACALVW